MRLDRRMFLIGGGSIAAAALLRRAASARPPAARTNQPIDIQATLIDHFSVTDPDARRFGALRFRSGLDLRCEDPRFGGFSSLWRSTDGRQLVSVADNAQWLAATIETRNGQLAGLGNATLAPLLNESGRRLSSTAYYDTESIAIADGVAYVGIERRHAVMRFGWGKQGILGRGRLLVFPDDLEGQIEDLPNNSGLEAIGVAPPRSPLAGAVIAVAEHAYRGENSPTLGFILTGPNRGTFRVERSDGYDISDLAFLPDGDVLLLERQFSLFEGFRIRLRRLAANAIRPDAEVNGTVLFESNASQQIDNMEGLAVHREGSDIVLTMISDDNFSSLQRTLLLEFVLSG